MCLLGQINPTIHLSVPFRNWKWKEGKTDPPNSFWMVLHKGYMETCEPRVPWWQKGAVQTLLRLKTNLTCLTLLLKNTQTNGKGVYKHLFGGKGKDSFSRHQEKVQLAFWHCCQSWGGAEPHWNLLVIPHMLPPARVLAAVEPVGAGTPGTGKDWAPVVEEYLYYHLLAQEARELATSRWGTQDHLWQG